MASATVLLIDDEKVLRRSFQYALEDAGFAVWAAEDGREGVDLFHQIRPDVVVTDILMPDMDGFTAIDLMHRANRATPIIAISGATGQLGRLQAERCGARIFLRKPVSINALLSHIDGMFDQSSMLSVKCS